MIRYGKASNTFHRPNPRPAAQQPKQPQPQPPGIMADLFVSRRDKNRKILAATERQIEY